MPKNTLTYSFLSFLLIVIPFTLFTGCASPWSQGTVAVTLTPPSFDPRPELYSIYMVSPSEGWAVGGEFVASTNINGNTVNVSPKSGTILHYSGGKWIDQLVNQPLFSVSMVSAKDGWAAGYNGELLYYDGSTWTQVTVPTSAVLRGVFMLSAKDGWIVGYGGTILHYNGGKWTSVNSPTNANLRSVYMTSAKDGWAVGDAGTLLHYVKGQWMLTKSATTSILNSVFMLSSNEGWAVGEPSGKNDNTNLLHYSGGRWTPVNSPYVSSMYGVFMSSLNQGWIASTAGTILHYDGGTWTFQLDHSDSAFDVHSVFMTSANEGWAVGQENLIRHYQNGKWTTYSVLKRLKQAHG
jgi:photosystem II stability/assembly factor-like uncharacterized protein